MSSLAAVVVVAFALFLIGLSGIVVGKPALAERLIGWAIVISSTGLMLVPWRWHHRFGQRVLPMVGRHLRLFAAGLFAFGVLLLYSTFSTG